MPNEAPNSTTRVACVARETGRYMCLSIDGETSRMKLRPVSLLNTKYGSTPTPCRQSPRAARCSRSSCRATAGSCKLLPSTPLPVTVSSSAGPNARSAPVRRRRPRGPGRPRLDRLHRRLHQPQCGRDDFGRLGLAEHPPFAPAGRPRPDLPDLVGARLHLPVPAFGDVVHLAPVARLDPHQPLVLQLLQGGIDGAGAGLVGAVEAGLQPVHQLITVIGLLVEQGQQRQPQLTVPEEPPGWPAACRPESPPRAPHTRKLYRTI